MILKYDYNIDHDHYDNNNNNNSDNDNSITIIMIKIWLKPFYLPERKKETENSKERKKKWLTWMPAKNGSRTAFEGDHTFFGDVVNIAETLHDIC